MEEMEDFDQEVCLNAIPLFVEEKPTQCMCGCQQRAIRIKSLILDSNDDVIVFHRVVMYYFGHHKLSNLKLFLIRSD